MQIKLKEQEFTLLYEKALYKADEALLIIADVHLGKARHFRKEGLAIPASAQQGDYDNLQRLFRKMKPSAVYFLGDLFHSDLNNDWHDFSALIGLFPSITFTLIKGNHDRIDHRLFAGLGIAVVDTIEHGKIIYSHEPLAVVAPGCMNIAGHIHPGIVLSGMGRQSLKLPCFHITPSLCILPAFGVLTGLYTMGRSNETEIYMVLPDCIRKL